MPVTDSVVLNGYGQKNNPMLYCSEKAEIEMFCERTDYGEEDY